MYVHWYAYIGRIGVACIGKGTGPSSRMPFAEPETALPATIDPAHEGKVVRREIARPGACQRPPTTFQSLTRRLNDLAAGEFLQALGGDLGRDVALRGAKHFEADHELADGG